MLVMCYERGDSLAAGKLRLAYVGLRDIDAEEGRMLRRSSVRCFTMRDVDKFGIAKVQFSGTARGAP